MTEGRRPSRRVRGLLLVILAALAAVAFFFVAVDHPVPIERYRVRDDDTIVISVFGGGNWYWTRVASVDVTPTTVSITVRTTEVDFLPHTDIGINYEFVVDLDAPLGDRVVVDTVTDAAVPLVQP